VNHLLVEYLKPHKKVLGLIAFLLLIQAVGTLYLPNLNADIINDGVVTGDTGYIIRVGAMMLAVSAVLGAAAIVAVYFSARTAMRLGRDIRADLFRRVESFSLSQMYGFGVPSLITRNTNDVQQLQMLVMVGLTMMLLAPITAVGGAVMAVRENVQLSALLLVMIPLMIGVISLMIFKAIPLFRSMQVKIDKVNGVLRENLTGIRVIRAFVKTSHEEARFQDANDDLTATALRVTRLFALMIPALMLIMYMASVATIWFGGHLVADGSMPIGNMIAFQYYIILILGSVMMAVMTLMMVPRAAAAGERIRRVLDTLPDITEPSSLDENVVFTGRIELRDVEFRYPGAQEPVLSDVSFTMAPGTTTAIVGGTGSGKTTLVNLLPRLMDVTSGQVLIDGVDIKDIPLEQLWQLFGIVPQKAFLFTGTVGTNVRFGHPEATDAEVWAALDVAQAREFVDELPDGLDSEIEQGGANLSGGQRQRMAIARCLVRRPLIYLFDDSFSALDYSTDARLRAALVEQTRESTVAIVAQRVRTIMDADQIVVLDAGRVVGLGRHEDLIEDCEPYREIVLSQMSLEEAG